MERIPKMVDLALSQEGDDLPEAVNLSIPAQYPYGLSLCLDNATLEKLEMDDDCEVGDHVHFHALAKVTSCSDREGMGKRIELQIVAMSAEDENEENETAEEQMLRHKIKNPYDR